MAGLRVREGFWVPLLPWLGVGISSPQVPRHPTSIHVHVHATQALTNNYCQKHNGMCMYSVDHLKFSFSRTHSS